MNLPPGCTVLIVEDYDDERAILKRYFEGVGYEVCEAGDGEDGRIKSAIGIGSLLLDGLGDTIRVSLTEDSVYEIPVAQAIAAKAMSLWKPSAAKPTEGRPDSSDDGIDPFHFEKRETTVVELAEHCVVGPEQPPRVIVRVASIAAVPAALKELVSPKLKDTPTEGLLVAVESKNDLDSLRTALDAGPLPMSFLALELSSILQPADLESLLTKSVGRVMLVRKFAAGEASTLRSFVELVRKHRHFLACDLAPAGRVARVPCDRHPSRRRFRHAIDRTTRERSRRRRAIPTAHRRDQRGRGRQGAGAPQRAQQ